MIKKYFRYLFRILSILFICVLVYLVYIIFWLRYFNAEQRKAVENIRADFYQTSPIIRDHDGYFRVIATINELYVYTLLFDTQASASRAKQEALYRYKA